jgi:hypothetical protein
MRNHLVISPRNKPPHLSQNQHRRHDALRDFYTQTSTAKRKLRIALIGDDVGFNYMANFATQDIIAPYDVDPRHALKAACFT